MWTFRDPRWEINVLTYEKLLFDFPTASLVIHKNQNPQAFLYMTCWFWNMKNPPYFPLMHLLVYYVSSHLWPWRGEHKWVCAYPDICTWWLFQMRRINICHLILKSARHSSEKTIYVFKDAVARGIKQSNAPNVTDRALKFAKYQVMMGAVNNNDGRQALQISYTVWKKLLRIIMTVLSRLNSFHLLGWK